MKNRKAILITGIIMILSLAVFGMSACGSGSAESGGGTSVAKTETSDTQTAKETKAEKKDKQDKSKKKSKDQKKSKSEKESKKSGKSKTSESKKSESKNSDKSSSKSEKSKSSSDSKSGKTKDNSSKNGKTKDKDKKPAAKYCYISITCHVLNKSDCTVPDNLKKFVPKSGVILSKTKMKIEKGDTVLDISVRATKNAGIHFAYQGTSSFGTAYVEGINNIYEMDITPKSGWLYYVNGSKPGKGCSAVKVSSGDVIEWAYTNDLGKDQ